MASNTKRYYSTVQVARELGVSEKTALRYAERLGAVRHPVSNHRLYPADRVEAMRKQVEEVLA